MISNPGFLNLADGATENAATERVRQRVEEIGREIAGEGGSVERLRAILDDGARTADSKRDALSTQLATLSDERESLLAQIASLMSEHEDMSGRVAELDEWENLLRDGPETERQP